MVIQNRESHQGTYFPTLASLPTSSFDSEMLKRPRSKLLMGITAAAVALTSVAYAATQCYGTNRDGTRCRNQVAFGSYCYLHSPSANKCAARAADGSQCRNNATSGSSYCSIHSR